MSAEDYELSLPPTDVREEPDWLQDAAGWLLMNRVRSYAQKKIAPGLSPESKAAAEKAIHDTLYGLMMLIEGVSPQLSGPAAAETDGEEPERDEVRLVLLARHLRTRGGEEVVEQELDLGTTGELCMAFHGWVDGEFDTYGFVPPQRAPARPAATPPVTDAKASVPVDDAAACGEVWHRDRNN